MWSDYVKRGFILYQKKRYKDALIYCDKHLIREKSSEEERIRFSYLKLLIIESWRGRHDSQSFECHVPIADFVSLTRETRTKAFQIVKAKTSQSLEEFRYLYRQTSLMLVKYYLDEGDDGWRARNMLMHLKRMGIAKETLTPLMEAAVRKCMVYYLRRRDSSDNK